MNKRKLYESIIKDVSKTVKKYLNEANDYQDSTENVIAVIDKNNVYDIIDEIKSNIAYALRYDDYEAKIACIEDICKALNIPEKYYLKYTIEIPDWDEYAQWNIFAYLILHYPNPKTIPVNSGYEIYNNEETVIIKYAKPEDNEFRFYFDNEDGEEIYITYEDFSEQEDAISIIYNYYISHNILTKEELENIEDAICNKI